MKNYYVRIAPIVSGSSLGIWFYSTWVALLDRRIGGQWAFRLTMKLRGTFLLNGISMARLSQ